MTIKILGVDLAKNVFELCGLDASGGITFRRRARRETLLRIIAPQYVKPFGRRQKNDRNNAEVIAIAVTQARNQCLCSPTAKGCVHGQAVTALGPPTQAREVRLHCCFINEDNAFGQSRNAIQPSVGSVSDSYGNALAETVIGLFKAEVIHRRGPWRSFEAVEFATLEWVD